MAKTIVITGAGDGLGRALARRFAKDGETVILLGRTLSKVQAVADEIGAPHLALECDVAQPDSVRAAFKTISETHPKIDVLINNAAVYEPFTLSEVTDERIASQVNINLAGPIYCARVEPRVGGRGRARHCRSGRHDDGRNQDGQQLATRGGDAVRDGKCQGRH